MKCYIATYYKYNNYGTKLQNYALCQVLKAGGIEPITIYINNQDKDEMFSIKNKIKHFFSILPLISSKQRVWFNERKKSIAFRNFNQNLNYKEISYEELDSLDFCDAIAIAGSDQIWSPNHLRENKKDMKLFFLEFVPPHKRFAYAPSFGVRIISDDDEIMYKKKLVKFKMLSVREEHGKDIIYHLINESAPLIPDPVFLLTKDEWKNSLGYDDKALYSKEYILTYFLGAPNEEIKLKIKKYSNENNCIVINICGNYFCDKDIFPSPNKFVELIDKAKLVFTDSFHASAFSIILNTPFFVFERNDVKQFSRIETLLKKFDCKLCKIESNDFDKIDSLIDEMKKNSHKNQLLYEQKLGLDFINRIISIERGQDGK